MEFQKRTVGYWSAILVVIVLFSLIIVYMEGNSNVAVYKGEKQVTVPTETTAPPVDLESYTNLELGFRYGVPDDWIRVTKDGYDTYIHGPSATSLQVQINEYSPQLLTVNKDGLAAELATANCELMSFGWIDNSSFSSIYRKHTDSNTYLYIELTSFDRNNMVRLVFTVQEDYYERLDNTVIAMIDSFSWEKKAPFPGNAFMFYNTFGNFEFAYPANWNNGIQDNAFVAQDPDTGTVMSVVVNESTVTYEDFSQLDYVNWAQNQRSNFAISHYAADASTIYAVSSYSSNGNQMVLVQLMVASGSYEYLITFEVPYNCYSGMMSKIENLINAFRYFEE